MIYDTPADLTRYYDRLKQSGQVDGVIRYLTPNMAGQKCFKVPEAKAAQAAGMPIGLVFEVWGGSNNFAHQDINAGTGGQHGRFVRNYAPSIGCPRGTIIWYAIDNDVTTAWIKDLCIPYFKAIRAQHTGYYRVGIYGPGALCGALLDTGLVDAAWLSNAKGWNGYHAFEASGRATLIQKLPIKVAGIDADPDTHVAMHPDWGQFLPFANTGVTPATDTAPVMPPTDFGAEPHASPTGPMPAPPDIQSPDAKQDAEQDAKTPVENVGFFKRASNWWTMLSSGGALSFLGYGTGWQAVVAVILSVAVVIFIGVTMATWFIGSDNVRAWARRYIA